jgi:hypothetical protein
MLLRLVLTYPLMIQVESIPQLPMLFSVTTFYLVVGGQ